MLYVADESSSKNLEGRIVGGQDTSIEDYPYQVVMKY